ncbi:MAG: ARMT1-like domain-containing protein [Thermodesulfobacteriota bacterium]
MGKGFLVQARYILEPDRLKTWGSPLATGQTYKTAGQERTGLFPGCLECLLKLAGDASRLAVPGDQGKRARAEAEVRRIIEDGAGEALTSPQLANRALRALALLTGVADPYAEIKRKEMAQARETFDLVRPLLGDDLGSLLRLAVLGNSFDFFLPPEEALPRLRRALAGGFVFHQDDSDRLLQFLAGRPGLILYLTDNAGEVFFDLPLYQYLTGWAGRVVLVVKGGPGLNDLTRSDLEKSGLAGRFGDIADTGADGAGVDWDRVSPDFLDLVRQADLIVAKGMANFETLISRPPSGPAFHLFKVKCRPFEDYLNAPPESYYALWRG